MAKPRIGKLKPVYSLMLNPHEGEKLSKCPECRKLTYPRKFALLLHIEGLGPLVQGKDCKYCPRCKMIFVQQGDLEEQLRRNLKEIAPQVLGNEYFLVGVVETKAFKDAMVGRATPIGEVLEHVSELRHQYGLAYDPGGWRPVDAPPRVLPATRPQRIPTEQGHWWVKGDGRGDYTWVFEPEAQWQKRLR